MNVVIGSSCWLESDLRLIFDGEPYQIASATDLPTLMVEFGIYPSKSKAIQAGRTGEIPKGYTHQFKASKKVTMYIWNPSE